MKRTAGAFRVSLRTAVLALGLAVAGCGSESVPTSAGPTTSGSVDWQPPLGIPAPPFGIVEQAGASTYYVDNTHSDASDSGNGTPSRPRRTVPSSLSGGSVVEVRGGPYRLSTLRWTLSGTAGAPVFIRGVGGPVFTGDRGEIVVNGSHFVVEGLVLEQVKLRIQPGSNRFAIRRCEIRNWPDDGPTAMISLGGVVDAVVFANHIHHNGDPNSPSELDILGVGAGDGAQRVWIVDNHIHHMGGDSVRVGGSPPEPEPLARFLYVGRNEFHDNQENGLDVKLSRDVIVSQNLMYGFRPPRSGSDNGTALVVHYDAERVWILQNRLHTATNGVRCTGAADGFYVIGNVIWNIRHQPGSSYDPASLYGPHAIKAYSTPIFVVLNNTVFGSDAGISYATGGQGEIVNNIVADLTEAAHHVGVGSAAGGNVVFHNLLDPNPRIRFGSSGVRSCSSAMSGLPAQVQECLTGDPRFRDVAQGDFHLMTGSPALDRGIDHPAYERFRQLYGLDIRRDPDGRPRPSGSAYDLGAYEGER